MPRASGLLAPLLGLGLGLTLSLQGVEAAASCGALGPAERLEFTPASRARWLAPRVRAPGPLDPLYSTVRRFLAVVQLNPFPAGESPCLDRPGEGVEGKATVVSPPPGAPASSRH